MPCFHPLHGFRKRGGGFTFDYHLSNTIPMQIPCGQCIGCRVERKKEWALRLTHEAKLHDENCFITLTYREESLPAGNTLVKRHAQLFVKRLRKHLHPKKIRQFVIGEYGDQTGRAHYHAIIFGYFPRDAKVFSRETNANTQYTSSALESLWPHGYVLVSDCNAFACSYVAGYAVKKINGRMKDEHYMRVLPSGEMIQAQPEFSLPSNRPGIGAGFYEKFREELHTHDAGLLSGRITKLPRYYDKLHSRKSGEDALELVKLRRKKNARKHRANNTPERLAVREEVAHAKMKLNSKGKI